MRVSASARVFMVCAGLLLPPSAAGAQPGDEMPATLPEQPNAQQPGDEMPVTLPEEPNAEQPDAQDDRPLPLRFEGALLGALAVPFTSTHASAALGFAVTYGVGWGSIPLLFGVDFMSANSGNNVSPLALGGDAGAVNRLSTERTFYFDLWLRVQPPRWLVRPYVEGFLGTKLVQSRYTLARDLNMSAADGGGDMQELSDHAWASSYGWGAGVDLWGLWKAAGTITLTAGVRQLSGGRASFERPVVLDGQNVDARFTLKTTVTIFMVGIMGLFDMAAEPDPYAPGM